MTGVQTCALPICRIERDHRALLPDAPNLTCLMLPGGGHNIVRVLKGTGHLLPLVEAMMDSDAARIQGVTADFTAAIAAQPPA